MKTHSLKKGLFLFFVLLKSIGLFAQLPYGLIDSRNENVCNACKNTISMMPPEVMFGIDINSNGEVSFSINNKQYFENIFKDDKYGVTVDIVSKKRYDCDKIAPTNNSVSKGTILPPVYKSALLKQIEDPSESSLYFKIGKIPQAKLAEELEGNLIIVYQNKICFYTDFIDIERTGWELLPMGLFTDSLIHESGLKKDFSKDYFTFSKKIQTEVSFSKGSVEFSSSTIKAIYDSLELNKYRIKKIEIRAYSSVEGSYAVNKTLMTKRAAGMIQTLKKYQPLLSRVKIITAENWLYFYEDIKKTDFKDFIGLSKTEIKQRLTDKRKALELEPLLARERKVITTFYLEPLTKEAIITTTSIIAEFNKAVESKNVVLARAIQKELAERIIDNKLPSQYMNKIEVPNSKEFSDLLGDREVYKLFAKLTSENEALENLLKIKKIDSTNGKINYNICALKFFMWQNADDTTVAKQLLPEINKLIHQGIDSVLIKRMLINFYILKSQEQMQAFDYSGKNESIGHIYDIYSTLSLNDEDIYSLAKYYSYYSLKLIAKEIITPRIDKIDVSEDLVFYYLNLLFYDNWAYGSENFKKAVLNAVNLNTKRFCNFFLPNDKGGASMQLLEYTELKKLYCQECR